MPLLKFLAVYVYFELRNIPQTIVPSPTLALAP
jgi:hypothetical protein